MSGADCEPNRLMALLPGTDGPMGLSKYCLPDPGAGDS